MELGLQEKVVVITGGATGIGLASALAFAAEGCRVAICGRRKEKLSIASEKFKARGYDFLALPANVSSEQELQEFAALVYKQYGKINIWLNNAGVAPKSRLIDMSGDAWDELMRNNLKSVFLGSKIAANFMKRSGGGVILIASAFSALIPTVGKGAYAASKAAILALTKSFAAELAPDGIRVNAYIPGMISTEMSKERIKQQGSQLSEQIALHRLGKPEEVASVLVFFASDHASYITGASIEISGGKFIVQNPYMPWM